jgi:hypothetical protein
MIQRRELGYLTFAILLLCDAFIRRSERGEESLFLLT